MPTLTLMPTGEAAGAQSQYTSDCPNWMLIIVHQHEVSLESWCGRYLEYVDNLGDAEEFGSLINDSGYTAVQDGLYVVEGHVTTYRETESESRETEWHFDKLRTLTTEEWLRYHDKAEIWDPSYIDEEFVDPGIDEATSQIEALVEAAQGWLDWRKNIEIDLCSAEVALVAAIHAITDEGDEGDEGLSTVPE